ncbi:MAG: hypothetical protein AB8V06_02675 [Francisella endosymbiont of Hyalomma asiaticum]
MTIQRVANFVYNKSGAVNLVFVATGIFTQLHTQDIIPEKALKELFADNFIEVFKANIIFLALMAKHFIPKLAKDKNLVQ